jgi:hypothetical protein
MIIRPAPTRVLHTTRDAQNTWLSVARCRGQSEHRHIHYRTAGNNDLLEAYQNCSIRYLFHHSVDEALVLKYL